jgi:hypothetical protein
LFFSFSSGSFYRNDGSKKTLQLVLLNFSPLYKSHVCAILPFRSKMQGRCKSPC